MYEYEYSMCRSVYYYSILRIVKITFLYRLY